MIRLFRDDPEVTAVALPAFRYQCFAVLLQPVIVVANMTFQSVGKAGRATFLACCRQGVCFIPLILVLPRVLVLWVWSSASPLRMRSPSSSRCPFCWPFCGSWSRWTRQKRPMPRRSCNAIVTIFSRIFLQALQ